MKESIFAALVVVVFWLALPLLVTGRGGTAASPAPAEPGVEATREMSSEPGVEATRETSSEAAPERVPTEAGGAAAPEAEADFDRRFRLPVLREGETVSMELEEYLTGVLLGEMPMSFEPEALKAQAVACRTYALRSYGHRRHDSAALCTDSGCCMAWRDPEQAAPEDRAKAEAAVRATAGLVICYGDELIDATFFSCSGGRTEAAAAVWGSDLPYLQAVDSPGEEDAAHYSDELRIPLEEFRQKLLAAKPEAQLEGDPGGWVGSSRETPGGGVDSLELGGAVFRGTELRKLFGLRSTAFRLELTGQEAVFYTRGYGHRVGMSQYGAQAMALAGSDFREILCWYYQGVELRAADAD